MTLPAKTGRLSNAPVVYVLAQVQFSAITKLGEKYIPNIQERLRVDYPRFQHIQSQEISVPVGAGAPPAQVVVQQRWDINDRSNQAGFIIREDAIIYHTTAYTTFPEFLEKFRAGLVQIQEELHIGLTTRVGLRYVDLIVPEEKEALGQYVTAGLLGFPLEGLGQDLGQQAAAIAKSEHGMLVLRFQQNRNQLVLPPDLFGHTLTVGRTHPADRLKAILDTDHSSMGDAVVFTVDDVVNRLDRLHDTVSTAFKTIVTEYAWNKWR